RRLQKRKALRRLAATQAQGPQQTPTPGHGLATMERQHINAMNARSAAYNRMQARERLAELKKINQARNVVETAPDECAAPQLTEQSSERRQSAELQKRLAAHSLVVFGD